MVAGSGAADGVLEAFCVVVLGNQADGIDVLSAITLTAADPLTRAAALRQELVPHRAWAGMSSRVYHRIFHIFI